MFVIACFGLLMMFLSALMVINPAAWSRGIVHFSEKYYFHPFEILSRLGFGAGFVICAEQSRFPQLMMGIGYLLVAVGLGLLVTPPAKHKAFAVWSAQRFISLFRPAGAMSFFFGGFLIYGSVPMS